MGSEKNKILIVDDTKHVVVLLKHYCTRAGYETLEAYDGKEAILKIFRDKPDLVLLDAMMPEMSGFEVLKLIRNNIKTKFLPVIMVTALSELEDRVAALNAGVDDFLTKPVDSLLLITKIKSLLKAKNQREELDKIKFDFTLMLLNGLKKPLNNINNYSDKFKLLGLNDEQEKVAKKISENSEEMSEIVNKFLEFSEYGIRKMAIDKNEEILSLILDEVVNSLEIICSDKNIKIEKKWSDNLPNLFVDKNRILEVLMNVLERSINNSPNGGIINISAEMKEEFIVVQVIDSGKEICEVETLPIFNPFLDIDKNGYEEKTTDDLSMAVSKMIVEAHAGEILIEYKKGVGNIFKLKLPVLTS